MEQTKQLFQALESKWSDQLKLFIKTEACKKIYEGKLVSIKSYMLYKDRSQIALAFSGGYRGFSSCELNLCL